MYKLHVERYLRILWELREILLTPLSSSDPASHSDFICSGGRKQLQWHHNLVDESGRKKEKQNTENFDNHFVLPKSCCQCFHSWQTRTMYLSNKANLNKIENSKIFKRTTITSNAVPPNALKFHRSIK